MKHLIKMWNIKQPYFKVGYHILTLEVEYIYFLTGLSRRGEPISLFVPQGGDITTHDLIDQYYFLGTQMSEKQIPIRDVMDLPLGKVFFTMHLVVGIHGDHQESKAHMLYALEAMTATVFNWEEDLLVVLKDQLTKCQRGELKNFGTKPS